MTVDHSDNENIPKARRFFQGKKGKPNEIFENLRNPSEKVAYTIAKVDIPLGNDVAEAMANYAEGMSRSSDKPQAYFEKQIRKYLKEHSWEREEGREM